MGYSIEGDYFEACSCSVSCPCIFLAPATQDGCDVFLAWHITRGRMDQVDLQELNVALAVHAPQQMTDGGWTVALYLDERATAGQLDALGKIFSGQAGGHLANLAPLIGSVSGVSAAPIVFDKVNGSRRVRVGDVLEVAAQESKGMDRESPIVISNAPLGAVPQPLRQARADAIRYDGAWKFVAEGTNSFITEFRYEG